MQCFKKAVCLGIFLCAASCAQILVTQDYDRDVNFTGFKTYGWHAIERSIEMNDLVINRVKEAVSDELRRKGFRQVQENSDLLVNIHVVTRQKISISDWGYPSGGYWRRGYDYGYGYGYGGISSRTYEEGTLMIDMIDAAENNLVWRGTATDIVDPSLSPEERTLEINKAVALILQEFPPVP
jgi:hypothetical protein